MTSPPLDPTASALAHAVQGQFRLEREIGRGGMGVVYLATDLQLERPVAIKTLPPHLAADPAIRARFLREARTAAALSHPGIVPIYHAAERDGTVFFAMGYVEGESLAERVARGGPLSVAELVPMLVGLAEALGYAHANGVVHRDVKAENALIDGRTGRVLVTDFGIARVTEAQPLTATGTVLGTVHYMSPEQVTGDTLDGRSDLYALGVVAFFAATGRFPFERPSAPAVLVAHVNSAPPRLHELRPDAHEALDAIVARLLEKKPADRFADAAALVRALRDVPVGDASAGARSPLVWRGDANLPAPPPYGARTATEAGAPLSATEAQQVWARAAELQAHTGVLAPPPAFAPRGDGRELTTAYDAGLVRASAVDAGIDAKYVDRALAERAERAPVAVTTGEMMGRKPNLFLGSRSRIEFECVVDGEIGDAGFEEIAEVVRRTLGEMVNVSGVGRTLTVTTAAGGGGRRSNMPRQLQVHVSSRGGKTRLHAFENLQPIAGATFGIGMGAIGGGGGGMMMGIVMGATQNPAIALPVWLSWLAVAYGGARLVYARTARARERELRELLERLAQTARKHVVAPANRALPR